MSTRYWNRGQAEQHRPLHRLIKPELFHVDTFPDHAYACLLKVLAARAGFQKRLSPSLLKAKSSGFLDAVSPCEPRIGATTPNGAQTALQLQELNSRAHFVGSFKCVASS